MSAEISREELKRKLERKDRFFLVETLPAAAYNQGHIPGALNLPPDEVRDLAPEMFPDPSAEIVVYCGGPT